MLKLKRDNLVALIIFFILIPITILLVNLSLSEKSFYLTSSLIIIYSFIPFFVFFEKSNSQIKLLSLIAVMSALTIISRLIFYIAPQFKPVTAIVIITGIALGAEAGFMTGSISAFVSNFFFGQGTWTPWQMFCLGIIGFLSGLFFKNFNFKRNNITLSIWGFISSFIIYGFIINTSSFLLYYDIKSFEAFFTYYALSLPYDFIHAVSTIVFLLLLSKPLLYQLDRIKNKYNIA